MKSLILGCAGFAGSHLTEYLLAQGEEVIGLATERESLVNLEPVLSHVRIVRADVRDGDRLKQLFRETRPDCIYHLAAMSVPMESFRDPLLTYETNFLGSHNVLAAAREANLGSRVLMVSSADVYGSAEECRLPFREADAICPLSPYAVSKAAAELLARQFHRSHALWVVTARPFHHTGPRQAATFVCSGFAKQIVECEQRRTAAIVRVGNLAARRDFTDVRDIVRGYHRLMAFGQPGEEYNLCSGKAVSLQEVLQELCSLSSVSIEVEVDPGRVRERDTPVVYGDSTKATQAVGWQAEYPLSQTLRELKEYWEHVPHGDSKPLSSASA